MEKYYKEFNQKKKVEWTEMFTIMDYKSIIEKYWTRNYIEHSLGDKEELLEPDFMTFEKMFSFDIGQGMSSKKEKTKWISMFSSLRNNMAHEASKNKGLSKDEVALLKRMYSHCISI